MYKNDRLGETVSLKGVVPAANGDPFTAVSTPVDVFTVKAETEFDP